MRVVVLFEPSPARAIPFAAGPERYQRLADELGQYTGYPVPLVKDVLRNAPTDTYVLFAGAGDVSRSLADCGPALAAQLAPRTVLLDVSAQKALEQLEKHRLAGAVDGLRLSEWLAQPSNCIGPFGLRILAKRLGASCVSLPWQESANYCLLHSTHHHGMPHLLASYLAVYDALAPRSGPGIPDAPGVMGVLLITPESGMVALGNRRPRRSEAEWEFDTTTVSGLGERSHAGV
jgi:hypothetical protein